MNGRVYDPILGRMVSADPFVPSAEDLQAYNRYAYVLNNPLRYTDPDGFKPFWKKGWFRTAMAITAAIVVPKATAAWMKSAAAEAAATAAISIEAANTVIAVAPYVGASAGGFTSGLIASNGNVQSAVISAATAGGFNYAGGLTGSEQLAAHAAVGCASGAAQGGDCGRGALSAVVGKAVTVGIQIPPDSAHAQAGRFAVAVTSGGLASMAAGGKFENGAVTAAYGYLFNELSKGISKEQAGYEVKRDWLDYGDAVDHWKTGGGTDVRVPLASLDLASISSTDFPGGVGSTRVFNPSAASQTRLSDRLVYGNVTLTLVAPGVVQAGYDLYNFDVQPWSAASAGRNVATIGGGLLNSLSAGVRNFSVSSGRPFFIQLDGQANIAR